MAHENSIILWQFRWFSAQHWQRVPKPQKNFMRFMNDQVLCAEYLRDLRLVFHLGRWSRSPACPASDPPEMAREYFFSCIDADSG
uniref:hypothetical protein n=1 Tax=Salmonella sp. TaxID=599 RepID=UPI001CD982A0|nr:hypothetical protein [Salmonella sp.]